MKTRIYENTCIQCGAKVHTETMLGVPGGNHEDYSLRKISFECILFDKEGEQVGCGARFSVPLPDIKPTIEAKWEAGESIQ